MDGLRMREGPIGSLWDSLRYRDEIDQYGSVIIADEWMHKTCYMCDSDERSVGE